MLEKDNWRYIRQRLLDIIFPPSKRTRLVRDLTSTDLQNLPQASTVPAEKTTALYDYANKTVQLIVQATKYDGCRRGARIMGELLYDHLLTFCAENRIIAENIILVPIPLAKKRKRTRGFNQCERIIAWMRKQDDSNSLKTINPLTKIEPTKPQATLSHKERRQNVAESFSLDTSTQIKNSNLVIIDDVTTTGATFAEARETLANGNPESIHALAFAH